MTFKQLESYYCKYKRGFSYSYSSGSSPFKFITSDLKYYFVCPECGSNNIEHHNWYEAKYYERDIKFKCQNCKLIDLTDKLIAKKISLFSN